MGDDPNGPVGYQRGLGKRLRLWGIGSAGVTTIAMKQIVKELKEALQI